MTILELAFWTLLAVPTSWIATDDWDRFGTRPFDRLQDAELEARLDLT